MHPSENRSRRIRDKAKPETYPPRLLVSLGEHARVRREQGGTEDQSFPLSQGAGALVPCAVQAAGKKNTGRSMKRAWMAKLKGASAPFFLYLIPLIGFFELRRQVNVKAGAQLRIQHRIKLRRRWRCQDFIFTRDCLFYQIRLSQFGPFFG